MKKGLWLIFLGFLLLAFSVKAASYYGGGGWFDYLGYYSLQDLYEENYAWFDFFIYLLIFGGLAYSIYNRQFPGSGGNAISIGLGLGLSFGLVMWETAVLGESLFIKWGSTFILLIMVLLGFMLYSFFNNHMPRVLAIIISLVIVIVLASVIGQSAGIDSPFDFAGGREAGQFALFFIIIIVAYFFYKLAFKRKGP